MEGHLPHEGKTGDGEGAIRLDLSFALTTIGIVLALEADGNIVKIKGLPAGEYLAVAVDYAQEGAWNDPEYLAGLRDAAQQLELADAGSRVIPLTVAAK